MQKLTRKNFITGSIGVVAVGTLAGCGDALKGIAGKAQAAQWTMVINVDRCVGCGACVTACKRENNTPPKVNYTTVEVREIGSYPNVKVAYVPKPCMQCDNPPCLPVCPVEATTKRADGIVAIDYQKCIGCQQCVKACPYGMRIYDGGANYNQPLTTYEQRTSYEYNKAWSRTGEQTPVNKVRKCHYCLHRIENGQQPACVESCPGKARVFGNVNDFTSEVSRLPQSDTLQCLKKQLGTQPRTSYVSRRGNFYDI